MNTEHTTVGQSVLDATCGGKVVLEVKGQE